MSSQTVWVVYSSRKGGHIYPSHAIYSYIKSHSDSLEPKLINLLDLSWSLSNIDKFGRMGDLHLRHVFRKGYRGLQNNSRIMKNAYRFVEKLIFQFTGMKSRLGRYHGQPPDLILSIQPEFNVVAELMKSWFGARFHSVIIDLAVHGLWVDDHVDMYYVPNEHLKHDLMCYGVSASKIVVSGMPLRDGFASVVHYDVAKTRERLHLEPGLSTVLLTGGLLGKMFDFEGAIRSISDLETPLQIIAVFGKNKTVLDRTRVLKERMGLSIHSFGTVKNMHELMWVSDVVISKPGSVTISEVLSLGKPIIVVSPLAGSAQELRFAEFLEEHGAGIWVKSAEEVGAALKNIIGSGVEYDRMSKNAQNLGRYGLMASKAIFDDIKASLESKEE